MLLTVREIAARCHLSPETIRRYARSGLIRPAAGHRPMYFTADTADFITSPGFRDILLAYKALQRNEVTKNDE